MGVVRCAYICERYDVLSSVQTAHGRLKNKEELSKALGVLRESSVGPLLYIVYL